MNWEYLPPEYRDKHQLRWPELGLFDLKGKDRAFSKEDVSALFFANTVDRYLKEGGRIAFLVPQSLVKAALNHRGFRKFKLRHGDVRIRIDRVEDFVDIKPFEGVSNRTILVVATRGSATKYPVPYIRWTKVEPSSRTSTSTGPLDGQHVPELGEPSIPDDPTSPWTTGTKSALEALRHLGGVSAYTARTGVFTGGANAVFHLEPLEFDGDLVRVRNITERAKRVVPMVEATIETNYVYPLLRGREVTQWRHDWSATILLPHTADSRMRPVTEQALSIESPKALRYLQGFRTELAERRGFVGWEKQYLNDGFYACQRVGDYTFSPWKVVWRYIAPTFITAVIGPCDRSGPLAGKPLISNEKLMGIACSSPDEAYYLGGLLASAPIIAFVESRMVSTQIAPHLIRGLNLPAYDGNNSLHRELAELCRYGHELAASKPIVPMDLLTELDSVAAKVLDIDAGAAKALRRSILESTA